MKETPPPPPMYRVLLGCGTSYSTTSHLWMYFHWIGKKEYVLFNLYNTGDLLIIFSPRFKPKIEKRNRSRIDEEKYQDVHQRKSPNYQPLEIPRNPS